MTDTRTKVELEPIDKLVTRMANLGNALAEGSVEAEQSEGDLADALAEFRERIPGLTDEQVVRVAAVAADVAGTALKNALDLDGSLSSVVWAFALLANSAGKNIKADA